MGTDFFGDMSWFSLLGLVCDVCLLVQSISYRLGKTSDHPRRHYELAILLYLLGLVSTTAIGPRRLFGVVAFVLCLLFHVVLRSISWCVCRGR